jgi:hypothetical protein
MESKSMSAQVLQAVAKIAVPLVWDSIKNMLFKPDPNPVDDILGGQQKIMDLIESLDYKKQVRDPMDKIHYWTKRMIEVINNIQKYVLLTSKQRATVLM